MASRDVLRQADSALPRPRDLPELVDESPEPGVRDSGGVRARKGWASRFSLLTRAQAFDRSFVLRRLLAMSDLVALVSAGLVSHVLAPPTTEGLASVVIFLALIPVWILIANATGLYHLPDRRLGHSIANELGAIVVTVTLWSWMVLLGRAALGPGPVDLSATVALWVAVLISIAGLRTVTRVLVRRRAWYRQRVAIVGSPPDAEKVIRRLERHSELGLEAICVVDPAANHDIGPAIVAAAGGTDIDRVVVASSPGGIDQRSALIRALSELKVDIDLVSADVDAIPSRGALHYIEGLPMLTIPVPRRPRSRLALKRGFDFAVASLGLVVLSPILVYCAIRIRLDSPGPVLFRQQRVGHRGQLFEVVKFRSMVSGADLEKAGMKDESQIAAAPKPELFKHKNDPRLTEIGKTLRRWSLDELPQLLNVVRGDMSLVGPRPLIPEEAELVTGQYELRLKARPGMTGPWQTQGRSEIGFEDMVKLDYTYVSNWTFSEDLQLLVRTVGAVLSRHGAY